MTIHRFGDCCPCLASEKHEVRRREVFCPGQRLGVAHQLWKPELPLQVGSFPTCQSTFPLPSLYSVSAEAGEATGSSCPPQGLDSGLLEPGGKLGSWEPLLSSCSLEPETTPACGWAEHTDQLPSPLWETMRRQIPDLIKALVCLLSIGQIQNLTAWALTMEIYWNGMQHLT